MATMHGRRLGEKLCKALGVDPAEVSHIRIESGVNEAATAVFVRFVRVEEGDELVEIVRRYRLTEIEEP